MDNAKVEEVKDTALKLNEIRNSRPEDYFYLKGWIHCLAQNEGKSKGQSRNVERKIV